MIKSKSSESYCSKNSKLVTSMISKKVKSQKNFGVCLVVRLTTLKTRILCWLIVISNQCSLRFLTRPVICTWSKSQLSLSNHFTTVMSTFLIIGTKCLFGSDPIQISSRKTLPTRMPTSILQPCRMVAKKKPSKLLKWHQFLNHQCSRSLSLTGQTTMPRQLSWSKFHLKRWRKCMPLR